jgi:L-threonylcarbamoyladenylate synthase
MLKSHYAPNKKVFLWKGQNLDKRSGFLSFSEGRPHIHKNIQFVLSPKGNLTEAAQNLFKGLRYLDEQDIDTVYIELVPDEGLGKAINDRLKRAAASE